MTPLARLAGAWNAEPTVIAGAAAALALWALLAGPRTPGRAVRFGAGLAALLLALLSPLDVLSDAYLFSAHMLQHVLLTFVAPPLLLAGVGPEAWERLLARRGPREAEAILARPFVALPVAMGALALWHVPALYDAALASEPLHAFQHLVFLAAFSVFWWPLVAPGPRRLAPGAAIAYLGAAAAGCAILGVLVTFAPLGTWSHYLGDEDPLAIRGWLSAVITPAEDQQLGGLLMWVASTPLLLGPALAALGRAFRGGPGEERRGPAAPAGRSP